MFELWVRTLMKLHQVESPTWYAQYTQQAWEEYSESLALL